MSLATGRIDPRFDVRIFDGRSVLPAGTGLFAGTEAGTLAFYPRRRS